MKREKGFSLIELMIVVVIIGILSAIAIPNYNDYMQRSKLVEASSILGDLRTRMEQYYQDNRAYGVTTTTVCGITVPTAVNTAPWNNKFFTASCVTSNAGQNYLLTVTGSSQLPGLAFTLTDANVRGTTTFKGAAVTKACWLVKGSEC